MYMHMHMQTPIAVIVTNISYLTSFITQEEEQQVGILSERGSMATQSTYKKTQEVRSFSLTA